MALLEFVLRELDFVVICGDFFAASIARAVPVLVGMSDYRTFVSAAFVVARKVAIVVERVRFGFHKRFTAFAFYRGGAIAVVRLRNVFVGGRGSFAALAVVVFIAAVSRAVSAAALAVVTFAAAIFVAAFAGRGRYFAIGRAAVACNAVLARRVARTHGAIRRRTVLVGALTRARENE